MQTLNVGAGRTEEEHRANEEQRRKDLLEESQTDANFFFWAAGMAALGTGLLPVRVNLVVNIGAIDMLRAYARSLTSYPGIAVHVAAGAWVLITLGLGVAARKGHRWAFLGGVALYGADMLMLIAMFSLWAFGVHAFFVFKWYEGRTRLRDIDEIPVANAQGASSAN
ncbi:MAG: hypothetical protein ACRD3E_00540 [Terriglobales bacterium]